MTGVRMNKILTNKFDPLPSTTAWIASKIETKDEVTFKTFGLFHGAFSWITSLYCLWITDLSKFTLGLLLWENAWPLTLHGKGMLVVCF